MLCRVLVHAVIRLHKRRNLLTSQAVIRSPRERLLHAITEFSTLGSFTSSHSSVHLSACRYQAENGVTKPLDFFILQSFTKHPTNNQKKRRGNSRSCRTTLKTAFHENLPDFLDFTRAWSERWYSCSAHMQMLSRSGPTGNLGKQIYTFYHLNSVCQECT